MHVSDVVARATRTAVQLGLSTAVVQAVDATVDLSDDQVSAYTLLGTVLLSVLQGALENRTGKALLRKVPAPDQPVVDTGPGA